MPACSVCSHPEVEAINQAYQTKSLSKIAAIFGINRWTLGRHRACLAGLPRTPRTVVREKSSSSAPTTPDNLQADLMVARGFIVKSLERAEKRKDYKFIEKFVGLLHENVQIAAELRKKGAKPSARDHGRPNGSEVTDDQLEQLVGRAKFIPAHDGPKN